MLTIARRSTKPRPQEELVRMLHAVQADAALSRKMFVAFVQGICYGMGFILAVAVIIPVILFTLRRVDFPPMIATFVEDVIEQMERR